MNNLNFEIHFKNLASWNGVTKRQVSPGFYSLSLAYNESGYIRQTTPLDVHEQIVKTYSDEKYQFDSALPGTSKWGDTRGGWTLGFMREAYGSLKGIDILDIGAGVSYLGHQLIKENNVNSYTIVDPAIKEKQSDPKIQIVRDYFNISTCPDTPYDLVISTSCLEHIPDPLLFLKDIKEVLKRKNGKGILIFPESESPLVKGDFNAIWQEHISYFTKDSFELLLKRSGLKLEYCKVFNDTIHCMVGCGDEKAIDNPDKDTVLIQSAASFSHNVKHIKKVFDSLMGSNKKVAIHGATIGLNNALALANIKRTTLKEIILYDGDENKFGKYISMFPNPVRDSSDVDYKNVDHVIISTLTFYDEVKEFLISHHGLNPGSIHSMYPLNCE